MTDVRVVIACELEPGDVLEYTGPELAGGRGYEEVIEVRPSILDPAGRVRVRTTAREVVTFGRGELVETYVDELGSGVVDGWPAGYSDRGTALSWEVGW